MYTSKAFRYVTDTISKNSTRISILDNIYTINLITCIVLCVQPPPFFNDNFVINSYCEDKVFENYFTLTIK